MEDQDIIDCKELIRTATVCYAFVWVARPFKIPVSVTAPVTRFHLTLVLWAAALLLVWIQWILALKTNFLTLIVEHICKMAMSDSQKGIDHGRLKLEELPEAPSQLFPAFTEWIFSILWEIIHTEGICMICYFFFKRAPWLHVGGRPSQITSGALGYDPGFASQPCSSCPLNREGAEPAAI